MRPTDKLWGWDKYYAWRRSLWADRGYYPKVSKVTDKNEIIANLSAAEYRSRLWDAVIDQEQNAKLANLRDLLELKKLIGLDEERADNPEKSIKKPKSKKDKPLLDMKNNNLL